MSRKGKRKKTRTGHEGELACGVMWRGGLAGGSLGGGGGRLAWRRLRSRRLGDTSGEDSSEKEDSSEIGMTEKPVGSMEWNLCRKTKTSSSGSLTTSQKALTSIVVTG